MTTSSNVIAITLAGRVHAFGWRERDAFDLRCDQPQCGQLSSGRLLGGDHDQPHAQHLRRASVVITSSTLITQIYGIDPIGTSIAISQAAFPTADSAGAVVLARDDFFSDALAGGPLAAAVRGPMLLTEGADQSSSIDPRTLAEIQRVLSVGGTVYILGGDLAISPNVDATLEARRLQRGTRGRRRSSTPPRSTSRTSSGTRARSS